MDLPAKSLAGLLEGAGVGTIGGTSGWGIFLGRLPTAPDTAMACKATGGASPWPHLALNFPSVQIIVRGAPGSYEGAEAKAREVVKKLLGLPSQVVGNDFYGSVRQLGDVISLGFDEKNRPLFSCNFHLIVEPSADGYRQAIS